MNLKNLSPLFLAAALALPAFAQDNNPPAGGSMPAPSAEKAPAKKEHKGKGGHGKHEGKGGDHKGGHHKGKKGGEKKEGEQKGGDMGGAPKGGETK